MQKHVRMLGWLQIALGIIDLLIGMAGLGLLSGIGALTQEWTAFGALTIIGGFFGMFMLAMALPNLLCGIGLLRGWGGWVIILAVVLGVINLAQVPIGTLIALYTFWVAWRLYQGQGGHLNPR